GPVCSLLSVCRLIPDSTSPEPGRTPCAYGADGERGQRAVGKRSQNPGARIQEGSTCLSTRRFRPRTRRRPRPRMGCCVGRDERYDRLGRGRSESQAVNAPQGKEPESRSQDPGGSTRLSTRCFVLVLVLEWVAPCRERNGMIGLGGGVLNPKR